MNRIKINKKHCLSVLLVLSFIVLLLAPISTFISNNSEVGIIPFFGFSQSLQSKNKISSDMQEKSTSVIISNSYLELHVEDTGIAILYTADGKPLTFPGYTSDFGLKIDEKNYAINGYLDLTDYLTNYITQYPTQVGSSTVIVKYTISGIILTVNYTLVDDNLKISAYIENSGWESHSVGFKYQLDTQLDINDGSPLYSEVTGTCTYETKISPVTFVSWRAYDFWPSYSLTALCTMITPPDTLIFAHWPEAEDYSWSYDEYDPNRAFYTPGYTTSPESDSCVLMYWNPTTMSSGETLEITFYYGLSEPEPEMIPWKNTLLSDTKLIYNNILSSLQLSVDSFADILLLQRQMEGIDFLALANLFLGIAKATLTSTQVLNIISSSTSLTADSIGWIEILKDIYGTQIVELMDLMDFAGYEYLVINAIDVIKNLIKSPEGLPSTHDEMVAKLNDDLRIPEIESKLYSAYKEFREYLRGLPDTPNPEFNLEEVHRILTGIASQISATRSGRPYVIIPFKNPETGSHTDIHVSQIGLVNKLNETLYKQYSAYRAGQSVSLILKAVSTGTRVASVYAVGTIAGVPVAAVLAGVSFVADITDFGLTVHNLNTKNSICFTLLSVDSQMEQELLELGLILSNSISFVKEEINNPSIQDIQGEFTDLTAPFIIESLKTEKAVASIENNGPNSKGVIVWTTYTQTNEGIEVAGHNSLNFDVPAFTSKTVDLMLNGIDSPIWGGSYKCRFELWIGPKFIGYKTINYYVGPVGAITNLIDEIHDVFSGLITSGQELSDTYTTSPDSTGTLFTLDFPGSDIDLHVYDSFGNHVGYNYTTGEVDLEIPGAQYSGSQSNPEWVYVPGSSSTNYDLRVVGVSTESEMFNVSAVEILEKPATLYVSPILINSTIGYRNAAEEINLQISLIEAGGFHSLQNIQISATNLVGPNSISIDLVDISRVSIPSLEAGDTKIVTLTYHLPGDLPNGSTYHGIITVTSDGDYNYEIPVNLTILLLPKLGSELDWGALLLLLVSQSASGFSPVVIFAAAGVVGVTILILIIRAATRRGPVRWSPRY
ncbi:MAG: hypothetical protein Q6352_008470 [Candidatus Freyrarchaeum guaymaensis]